MDIVKTRYELIKLLSDQSLPLDTMSEIEKIADHLIENNVTISNENTSKEVKASTWFIISDECDGHYIQHFCDWHEALLEHLKWCKGNADEEMYRTALSGFNDRNKAIEFCNIILDREQIIFMAELNGEEFLDKNYFK